VTRRRLWSTVAVVVLAGLVLSATALWLALPRLARWAVVWQVEAQTGRRLTMARFDLDLRHGRLHIAGFRLADRLPGPPLVEFDRLDVRFHPIRLLRGHLEIADVILAGPRVHIVRVGHGELNISDLLARPASQSEVAPFTLDHLAVTDGAILFEDLTLTPPRTWRAEALTVGADALSSASPEPRGRVRVTTTVAGAPFSLDATGIALRPFQAKARVTLRDVDATLANLYLPPDTMVVLDRAVVGAAVDATVDAQGGVGLDGQARIANLVVRRRGVDASLFTVPALTFTLTSGKSPRADSPAGSRWRVRRPSSIRGPARPTASRSSASVSWPTASTPPGARPRASPPAPRCPAEARSTCRAPRAPTRWPPRSVPASAASTSRSGRPTSRCRWSSPAWPRPISPSTPRRPARGCAAARW